MRKLLLRRPSPGTVIALIALGVALGGVAYATIPDPQGTIHACYQKSNGNLRLVESPAECRRAEQGIAWPSAAAPGSADDARFRTYVGPTTPWGQSVVLVDIPGLLELRVTCEDRPDSGSSGANAFGTTMVLENKQASHELKADGVIPTMPSHDWTLPPGGSTSDLGVFAVEPDGSTVIFDFRAYGGDGKAAQVNAVWLVSHSGTCGSRAQILTNF
jgi:hypothetical protein